MSPDPDCRTRISTAGPAGLAVVRSAERLSPGVVPARTNPGRTPAERTNPGRTPAERTNPGRIPAERTNRDRTRHPTTAGGDR
ncbi:hypothetical protein BRC83_02780 [Halobacteriales archaeon QS_1_68_17]|nr:MAG: hypothetical protein BRC83_02780 [Halobacteriales archaeon QS_1_68_17]